MYSLKERTQAMQLYIESGCSESIVIRTLEYPSYNTLRNWYREYIRTGELHAATSAPNPVKHNSRWRTQLPILQQIRHL